MSALLRCGQSRVAPALAALGRRRLRGIAGEPFADVESSRTAWTTAARRAPGAAPAARRGRRCRAAGRRRTRPPPRGARRISPSNAANGAAGCASGRSRSRSCARPPAAMSSCDVRGAFRALALRVHRAALAVHDAVVDAVLEEARRLGRAVEPARVGLVLAEQQLVRRRRCSQRIGVTQSFSVSTDPSGRARSTGRAVPGFHDQVLRAQSCGSTCSRAASGPRFSTVIRIRMSSGAALAYSTVTSK